MNWASQEYRLWIITTNAQTQLYLWESWQHLFPHIDSLVRISPLKGAIRSAQAFERESGWLAFGRMIWSEKNNEKWTKKYREGDNVRDDIRFYDTEIWVPDWNYVEKNSVSPDILIKLDNSAIKPDREQGIIIAIRKEIADENIDTIETAVESIVGIVPASVLTTGKRSWAEEIYEHGYSNGLSDALPWNLAEQVAI